MRTGLVDYTTAIFDLPHGFQHAKRKSFPSETRKSLVTFFKDSNINVDTTTLQEFLIPGQMIQLMDSDGTRLQCRTQYSYPQGKNTMFTDWFFNTPMLIVQIIEKR